MGEGSVTGFGLRAAHSSPAFLVPQYVPGCQLTAVLLGLHFQHSWTSDPGEFNSAPLIISESIDSVE